MFLLDTVLLSETTKARPNPGVKQWIDTTPEELRYASVLSFGEIEFGLQAMASGRNRDRLEAWAADLLAIFNGRALPFELETSRIWGRKSAELKRSGRPVPTVDVMIAATAIQHGQTVVTRNQRHFEWCGVPVLNPWA